MSFTWIDGNISLANYRSHHENHFRKLLLEWNDYEMNRIEKNKLSNFAKLFMSTLEKNGFDPHEILRNELNNDTELRVWYENEIDKR